MTEERKWEKLEEEVFVCRKCERLVAWREEVSRKKRRAFLHETYWGKPVPGFGDRNGRVLVVGLAPGAHGANRTGRVFTGDGSGDFLFPALYKAGFTNQPEATHRGDGLFLLDMFITAVCRCVPPKNKPTAREIGNCLPYLAREIKLLENLEVIVTLGRISFDRTTRTLRDLGYEIPRLKFSHGLVHPIANSAFTLVASYHPSRQNTQTGLLTEPMFREIWASVRDIIQTIPNE